VGQRIRFGRLPVRWVTIVGVVGDTRQTGLEMPVEPALYLPVAQAPGDVPFMWPRHLVVRAAAGADPLSLAPVVRRVIARVDPEQPVANIRSMHDVVDRELDGRSTQLALIGGCALLTLVLAAIGLYGVLAFTVARQTPEIGLRMALGATRAAVLRGVVGHTLWLSGVGIAAGLAVAALVTRTLSSFLYAVSPFDATSFAGVALLLMVVALAACVAPARRATRIDPITALRAE
jgi:predicted lysophospholipase L1 biosynthesis ABC-type transport system permease subunit